MKDTEFQTFAEQSIIRHIRRPYFLFRTRDRLGSYFDRSHYRIVHFHKEPLTAFLPAAKNHAEEEKVVYNLADIDPESIKQMDYLPDSVITAFEQAARTFYGLDGFDERVTRAERDLRLSFKLPDPQIEPNAYLLYGPPENRGLLILWGTEWKEGSSLPLCPVSNRYPEGSTLLDRLKEMRMSWEDKQKETVALLHKRQHPLASFFASAVLNRKGELEAFQTASGKIPAGKVKPFKRIWPGALKQLQEAVDAFYEPCSVESGEEAPGSISAYEKELRLNFRLPCPERHPEAYATSGKQFLIRTDAEVPREAYLCLDEREDLGLPPSSENQYGAATAEDTVLDKLRVRVKPVKTYLLGGIAAAAVLLLTALISWLFWVDGTGPKLDSVVSENDFTSVTVAFSEPIEPDSIRMELPPDAQAAKPSFMIVDTADGSQIEIQNATLDENDPSGSSVNLEVGDLQDGHEYRLIAYNIEDRSIKSNAIEPGAETLFQPLDTLPPEKPMLSAHPTDSRKLVLLFNEPVEKRSAQSRDNYFFPNDDFRVSSVRLQDDAKTVELTADRTDRSSSDRGFKDGGIYSLTVSGISDTSYTGNIAAEPYVFENFAYLDRVAPVLESVRPIDQFDLEVTFNEAVTPETALKVENYNLLSSEGETPEIIGVTPAEERRRVVLRTSGLRNGIEYLLEARALQDTSGQENVADLMESEPFFFTGREDQDPPVVKRIRLREARGEISIEWAEPVRPETATDPANYAFVNAPNLSIVNIYKQNPENTIFSLVLNNEAEKHREYRLRVNGVADRIGNATGDYVTPMFRSAFVILARDLRIQKIEPVSSTELVITLNEPLLNHRNRASNQSYFTVQPLRPDSEPLLIRSIAVDAEDSTQLRCQLDPDSPLTRGQYEFRIEPGMRIEGNPTKDQIAVEQRFAVE